MQFYGGSGKHSKKKPEKDKRYEEYEDDYDCEYEDEYEDYEPQPRPRHQTARSRGRDIKSTNHTVYSGNGYDYEDDVHFASDDYVSREEMRSRKHRGRGVLVFLSVILILAIGGFAAFKIWAKPAAVKDNGPNTYDTDDGSSDNTIGGVEGEAPEQADSKRRPGVWTFLVRGLDREGLHTDTNIVGMFDTVEGKLNLVNLPRDLLINIAISPKQMNQPYPASINNGGDGISALLDAVKDILGYEVDCWAVIDIQAAADIVDAIGGVYYDIPFDMD